MSADVIYLTLAGGNDLLVLRACVIAAHAVVPGEADPKAKSRVYLSNGATLFVQETPYDIFDL
jgi:hypothetical protein